jgi:hypothetical protein
MVTAKPLAVSSPLGAGVADPREDRSTLRERTRTPDLSVGNTHACPTGEEHAAIESDWRLMYDMIVVDAGSSLGFVFAVSSGYGASLPM